MLDYTIENLRGMVGFVSMAKDTKYTVEERHGFLMFAVMHACQAKIHAEDAPGNRGSGKYGFTISDYSHLLIKAAEAVMNGTPIADAMFTIEPYAPPAPIDWNYLSTPLVFDPSQWMVQFTDSLEHNEFVMKIEKPMMLAGKLERKSDGTYLLSFSPHTD
jgi:hypothetical protein